MKTKIFLKRAYDPASPDDGFRIYVDRLWPRGLSHETFHYDLWEKNLAPSTELREWFHQDPDGRWDEFKERYLSELIHNPEMTGFRQTVAEKPAVTLLYSSHDHDHNNAVVLKEALTGE